MRYAHLVATINRKAIVALNVRVEALLNHVGDEVVRTTGLAPYLRDVCADRNGPLLGASTLLMVHRVR